MKRRWLADDRYDRQGEPSNEELGIRPVFGDGVIAIAVVWITGMVVGFLLGLLF
jgi:hypothetical protein